MCYCTGTQGTKSYKKLVDIISHDDSDLWIQIWLIITLKEVVEGKQE